MTRITEMREEVALSLQTNYNMGRKKAKWNDGSVFAIKLDNNKYVIGQVLDLRSVNCVRCAVFDEVFDSLEDIVLPHTCKITDVISLVEVTREQLDYGVWIVIGNRKVEIPLKQFPNEQYRSSNWIGAKTFDAALLEDFVNAYYVLIPWDDWHDPNYLNRFLIDASKKPVNLIYIKK
jgi:hypothetical protein